MIALRRSVVPLVVALVILAVLFYALFPTRTFLEQSSALADVQSELDALYEENDALPRPDSSAFPARGDRTPGPLRVQPGVPR